MIASTFAASSSELPIGGNQFRSCVSGSRPDPSNATSSSVGNTAPTANSIRLSTGARGHSSAKSSRKNTVTIVEAVAMNQIPSTPKRASQPNAGSAYASP